MDSSVVDDGIDSSDAVEEVTGGKVKVVTKYPPSLEDVSSEVICSVEEGSIDDVTTEKVDGSVEEDSTDERTDEEET